MIAAPAHGSSTSPSSRLVCYSLVTSADRLDAHELQFELSVGSLRSHNPQVPVVLFVHDALPSAIESICRQQRVMVHHQGSYAGRLRAFGPPGADALAQYPVLHKQLNFAEIAATGVDQALCCDLDTIFFDDVDLLFDRYAGADVAAREEVFSRRSVHGTDPTFIDEPLLERIATALDRRVVPPFNLGLVLYSSWAVARLVGLMDTFVDDVWRLCCGQAAGAGRPASDAHLLPWIDATRAALTSTDVERALPYPSSSGWLVEEVALWLTLGAIPGLTVADISPHDVAQNGEIFGPGAAQPSWLACHYYTHNMPRVLEWLRATEPVGSG